MVMAGCDGAGGVGGAAWGGGDPKGWFAVLVWIIMWQFCEGESFIHSLLLFSCLQTSSPGRAMLDRQSRKVLTHIQGVFLVTQITMKFTVLDLQCYVGRVGQLGQELLGMHMARKY